MGIINKIGLFSTLKTNNMRASTPFIRQEGFENQISEINSMIEGINYSDVLNDRKFTLKSTDQTYRKVNHWESKELLPNVRQSDKEWRKYSLVDLVWLGTIRALRDCGYPLKKIKSGYDQMNEWYSNLSDASDMPIIEHYITRFIALRLGFYCVAFSDGIIDFIDDDEYFVNDWITSKVDHIKISVVPIFNKFIPGDDIKVEPSQWVNLTEEEYRVIGAIRNPDNQEIAIKGKDGKVELLDITRHSNSERRIIDLLKEGKYQDINIKQVDGKIVNMTQTIKERFK